MKVKAKISFAGPVCMARNEVRDIPEDAAAPLLKCGYLEPEEEPSDPPKKPPKKPSKAKKEK